MMKMGHKRHFWRLTTQKKSECRDNRDKTKSLKRAPRVFALKTAVIGKIAGYLAKAKKIGAKPASQSWLHWLATLHSCKSVASVARWPTFGCAWFLQLKKEAAE